MYHAVNWVHDAYKWDGALQAARVSGQARRAAGREKFSRRMRFFPVFLRIAKSPPQKRDHGQPVWIGYAP